MEQSRHDVLIVGGGHGGAQVASTLRHCGFSGSVTIVGAEAYPPYERPALSKDYLAGGKAFERLMLKPQTFWRDKDVGLLLGRRIVRVDARAHRVLFADGTSLGFGQLVWAAGGEPRRLACAGHDIAGVHTVRTKADVDQVARELEHARHVVVVGGGYIGLEAAAVVSKLVERVTILEAQSRLMSRVAGAAVSSFFEAAHRAHGVDVRLAASVACIEERDGRAWGVRLADGELLACDMVIVGVGIVPAVEPLIAAGAVGGNGVQVDALCRTSLDDVFAIGDCALHANPYADWEQVRLESVQNANDQAIVAAKAITGTFAPYSAVPWFWSNQYDIKLQTLGLSTGYDREIVRGDPAAGGFSVIYVRKGRIVALDCINAVRDYVQGKALLMRSDVDLGLIADPATPLKAIGRAV